MVRTMYVHCALTVGYNLLIFDCCDVIYVLNSLLCGKVSDIRLMQVYTCVAYLSIGCALPSLTYTYKYRRAVAYAE
jgi:hypothetical protein